MACLVADARKYFQFLVASQRSEDRFRLGDADALVMFTLHEQRWAIDPGRVLGRVVGKTVHTVLDAAPENEQTSTRE